MERRRSIDRDRCEEPVAATGESLNEARTDNGVAQGIAQFVNGRVQAVVEVYEGILLPDLGAQFLASDYIIGPLQQDAEDLKRLFLKLDAFPLLAQLACA
ncbi:MAG: hypothetical protein WA715_13115 [Candidatus Acidiferrum sp.]